MKEEIWFAWTGQPLPDLTTRSKQVRQIIDACQRPTQAPAASLRLELQQELRRVRTTAEMQTILIQEAMRAAPAMRRRWEEIYRQYRDPWYGYLQHGFSLDADTEAEIFSALAVRVLPWKLIQEELLEEPIQWQGFLWTCVKREVLAWYKHNARERLQETDLPPKEVAQANPSEPDEWIEYVHRVKDLIDFIDQRIENAPGEASQKKWMRRRRVLNWLLLEEWSQTEIATELGVRKGVISDDVGILRERLLARQSQNNPRETSYEA